MEINIQKLQMVVTGILATAVVGFFSYLGYMVFLTGPKEEDSPTLATVNVGTFSSFPKIAKVAAAVSGKAEKFALKKKDYQFIDSTVYKSFVDEPVSVPLSDKRGRPDPFVPYSP